MIERATDCEIRSVIRFLNTRNVKLADIHRQIREVYGENATSDGMVRKWVRKFKESHNNLHDEPRSGRPSVVPNFLKNLNNNFYESPPIGSRVVSCGQTD
jgi:hypothetical protein